MPKLSFAVVRTSQQVVRLLLAVVVVLELPHTSWGFGCGGGCRRTSCTDRNRFVRQAPCRRTRRNNFVTEYTLHLSSSKSNENENDNDDVGGMLNTFLQNQGQDDPESRQHSSAQPQQDNDDNEANINKNDNVAPEDPKNDNNVIVSSQEANAFQCNVPSVSRILQFAIPAIGVWLCSPLLSMIDTSVVGLLSGTLQQAALSPAVVVTDYSARTLAFLYTGTTNLMAVAQQQDVGHLVEHHIEKSFIGALRMALIAGSGLGLFLFLFANPLTHTLIGSNKYHGLHDPEVFHAAQRYVRIRALGMPAAAMIGTSQAACLGLKDVKSPLRVIALAAVVNLCSDLILVGQGPAWLGGAAGAAWATSFSQYVALTLFLRWLTTTKKSTTSTSTANTATLGNSRIENDSDSRKKKSNRFRFPWRIQSLASTGTTDKKRTTTESFSTRGILAQHWNRTTLFQGIITPQITQSYQPYVIPVTTTQIGRTSTYIAMGHVVASSFGTISMAAHQVITSIFYSLIPIADSLSLTMQSFLPGIVAQEPSPERAKALRTTIVNLYKVAGIFGAVLAGVVACIPILSKLFTTDPAVQSLVSSIVPILFAIFALHGVFCGSEGILLGQRDLTFLGRMYAIYFCVVPLLMLRIKALAAQPLQQQQLNARMVWGGNSGGVSLRSVWSLFLGYQLVRILVWVGRVAWLQRRVELQAAATTTTTSSMPTEQQQQ